MAFLDRAGWMKTIEDTEPLGIQEKRSAARVVASCTECPEDALELMRMLGITEAVGLED